MPVACVRFGGNGWKWCTKSTIRFHSPPFTLSRSHLMLALALAHIRHTPLQWTELLLLISFNATDRNIDSYRKQITCSHIHAIFTCRTQILLSDCMAVLISRTSFAANANYENLSVAPRTVYIMLHAIPFHFNHLMDIAKLNHIKRKKCWIFHLLF